ncbi:MAG: DMT family transporter [Candidatus Doudnabacteria bacterium]|nr:DMT family transporter [Candidatus Doudnabacteria bacterium]
MTETKKGESYILAETLLWSLFPVITVISLNQLRPMFSLALSSFFAAIFFACVITYKKLWHELKERKALWDVLWGTLLLGIIYYLLQFAGLSLSTPGNAALVSQMEILFSFLLFNVWKKERIDFLHLTGSGLMLMGAAVVLLPKGSGVALGDLLILISAAVAPFGNLFQGRARKQISSYTIMFLRNAISFPVILFIAFLLGQTHSEVNTFKSLWPVIINGIFLLGISKILWLEAIHRIPVVKANAFNCIGPAFTLIYAYLLLGQRPNAFQIFSLVPISIGIYLLTRPAKQTP